MLSGASLKSVNWQAKDKAGRLLQLSGHFKAIAQTKFETG